MCGINGIFAYHYAANPIDRDELIVTRDHMAARGPDGMGAWVSADNRVGFGHRRLSIIDLSDSGAQPMLSADGNLVITFNGEIYNYRELRRKLEAKGRVFRSESDTEVLLHLYAEQGESMVHALRGMFAFALWDAERRSLFLARDPYGIKPLYYADDGWTVRFASQVKALLAGNRISRERDPAGVVGFYIWGSVPEPFTTLRDVRAVPAGTFVTVNRIGAAAPIRYHSIAAAHCEAERHPPSRADARELIREALLDSVRQHLVADVPVGAFLSAGIDSGALVGLMRDASSGEFQTITLSFDEYRGRSDDEGPLAAEVAKVYGTKHTNRTVTEREFQADLPRILNAMDQPSIDGINTWFVSKAAHELGLKVAISGLGGDELFGGYPSFHDIPLWVRWFKGPSRMPFLGIALREVGRSFLAQSWGPNPKALSLIEFGGTYAGGYLLRRGLFMPWELGHVLDKECVDDGLRRLRLVNAINAELLPCPKSAFARVATLESTLYMRNQLLRDTDWASMAHSLEVRVPLVDAELLRVVAPHLATVRSETPKAALAASPATALPAPILHRKKTGFTTPIATWLQRSPRSSSYTDIPALRANNCPWARRWAHGVATL